MEVGFPGNKIKNSTDCCMDGGASACILHSEVEFLIKVHTRECALKRSLCTSEYPYGRGESGLVINTMKSAYKWYISAQLYIYKFL
jgi:hypothetical protein